MERTRRSFIRGAAAACGIAGMSGTALAGCKEHDGGMNEHDCPDDPPGNEYGQAEGHDKDEGDPGGEAHDRDNDPGQDKPGRRIGHCKYD